MALYPLLYKDGKFGDKTREYFQRYMRVNGWYTRAVDGAFGRESWKGVQRMGRYHGFYTRAIDGDPGPYTWRALERTLFGKFPFTGKLNNVSYGNYEMYWSYDLVWSLQNGLNTWRYNTTTYPRVHNA